MSEAATVNVTEGGDITYQQEFKLVDALFTVTMVVHIDRARRGRVKATISGHTDVHNAHLPGKLR